MRTLERKHDTREKIKLGGLVKKSGLHELSTAALYGLLIEANEKLSGDDADRIRADWQLKGDLALTLEHDFVLESSGGPAEAP